MGVMTGTTKGDSMRTGLAVAAAALAVAAVAAPAGAQSPAGETHHLFRTCAQEDSVSCVWQATGPGHQGNGFGDSFWTDAKGRHHYIRQSTARAMRLARGEWRRVRGTRWEGTRWDSATHEGCPTHCTFRLGPRGWISVGDTTWAKQAGLVNVGSS